MSGENQVTTVRVWHKAIPMKELHEKMGLYQGKWSSQMDRYWESNDGYTVSSRLIRTEWGVVEHVAISRMSGDKKDLPWAVKQQIKNELFGRQSLAIEVFPAHKHLIDATDVYHLWVMPKGFMLPFGLHPIRDPQCSAVERGYDYDMSACNEWFNSDERKSLMGGELSGY